LEYVRVEKDRFTADRGGDGVPFSPLSKRDCPAVVTCRGVEDAKSDGGVSAPVGIWYIYEAVSADERTESRRIPLRGVSDVTVFSRPIDS
jgi:hypothetical protein